MSFLENIGNPRRTMQLAYLVELKSALATLKPAIQPYCDVRTDFIIMVDCARVPFSDMTSREEKFGYLTVIHLDSTQYFCAPTFADELSARNFGEAIVRSIINIVGETMAPGIELLASIDKNQFN